MVEIDPGTTRAERVRVWRRSAAASAVALGIAGVIWWPFDFSADALPGAAERVVGWGLPLMQSGGLHDVVRNVAIFFPLGFLLSSSFRSAIHVGIAAAALSSTIEIVQLFQPQRVVSFLDVLWNTCGALTGWSSVPLVKAGKRLVRAPARDVAWAVAISGPVVVVLVCYSLQSSFGALSSWSEHYPLQIGNEATGDRAWCGTVEQLTITTGDRTWKMEDLDFSSKPRSVRSCPGDSTWLQSRHPASDLANEIRRSGRLYLTLSARPALLDQDGPARIFSWSADSDRRNLTIGQDSSDLIVRIRRWGGGSNGVRPFYRLPKVFGTGTSTSVSIEVTPALTRIAAGGKTVEDRHDVSGQWWILLLPSHEWQPDGPTIPAQLLFWLVVMGPFGALLHISSSGGSNGLSKGPRWWGGALHLTGVLAVWGGLLVLDLPASFATPVLIAVAYGCGWAGARLIESRS